MKDAKAHLSKDPILKKLIAKHQIKEYWGGHDNYFLDLIEIITGQQLSMKAAKSIFTRFLNLYSGSPREAGGEVGPNPQQVVNTSAEKLRAIGFSTSKANYVQNIAKATTSGALLLDQLEKMTDEEIKNELTKIKGIGPWSAEMFLIFSLKRPDVFSVGDLGLRTAIEKLYSINRDDLKAILTLSQTWSPPRPLAARLLWASLDN